MMWNEFISTKLELMNFNEILETNKMTAIRKKTSPKKSDGNLWAFGCNRNERIETQKKISMKRMYNENGKFQ